MSTTTDRIILSGMRFFGHHGAMPEETRLGQTFYVDLELYAPLQAAGLTDDLDRTINYAAVYEMVKGIVEGPPFKLIEAVAERVAAAALATYPVSQVAVRVHKPGAPIPGHFDDAAVEIWRRRVAYLSLGSNLGDRLEMLTEAVRRLAGEHVTITAASSVYETAPQGKTDQPAFLNLGLAVGTDLPPEALLAHLLQVEYSLGRVRVERWGPRVIDIDLILYGPAVIDNPALTLPHPRAAERAFVLAPLLELAPDLTFPGGEPLRACLDRLPEQGVKPVLSGETFLRRVSGVQ